MKAIAIIPARGGSKGIPRKNVRPIAGKPLIAHTIGHALGSTLVDRVFVSTDDAEIARTAKQFGAEVIERPADISGDTASSESALLHALTCLREQEGYTPDLVVFLQATSPLRRADDIDRAVRQLLEDGADSLFSASTLEGFLWRMAPDGPQSFSYDYRRRPRRQDAPVDVVENGSIYVFRPEILIASGNRLGGRIATYLMDPLYGFQIDSPHDLRLLEALMAFERAETSPGGLGDIELLALDFDGVFTDNTVIVAEDGRESVVCSRADGMGISMLRDAGVEVVVISKERNPVVAARARKVGICCIQACDDKLPVLEAYARERGIARERVAYMGDDINDLACLGWAGTGIAVANAVPAVLAAASRRTERRGGSGAIREVAEWILAARQANSEQTQEQAVSS